MIKARRIPTQSRKLLVIDDDEKLVGYYKELLTPYGFEVLIAHDGEQAIPLVEQNPDIQLVILDVSMPRMDGREWLRWFRTRRTDTPVVVITGYKFEEEEDLKTLSEVYCNLAALGVPLSGEHLAERFGIPTG